MIISLELEGPCYAKQSKIQLNAFYHYSGVTTSLQATVVIFSRFSGERRETRDMRGDHDIVVFLAPRVHLALAPFSLLEKKRVLLFSNGIFLFIARLTNNICYINFLPKIKLAKVENFEKYAYLFEK